MYSSRSTRVRLLLVLAAVLAASGCGGSSSSEPEATKVVRGPGFAFETPASRTVQRTPKGVSVLPPEEHGVELEWVTRRALVKRFRPTLWPGVVTELDGSVGKLAADLAGEVVSSRNVRIAGHRGRQYEIAYEQQGRQLQYRITFVFQPRDRFQLLCRYPSGGDPPTACTLMESTFRIV